MKYQTAEEGIKGEGREPAEKREEDQWEQTYENAPQNAPLYKLTLKINLKINRNSSSNIPHQMFLKGRHKLSNAESGTTPTLTQRQTDPTPRLPNWLIIVLIMPNYGTNSDASLDMLTYLPGIITEP